MSKFTHLHTHSHYSLLQALPKVPELVEKAKADGAEALALTDAGNMYGAIEFYKECKKAGLKPIIGVDFYVAARTRKDREPRIDNRRSRLVLLAKNLTGYKNLLKLVTYSHLEGFYYRPRIDKELIEKYHDGLIAISPSFSGEIAQALRGANTEKAKEWADFYKNNFEEDFYLEITAHPEIDGHEALMQRIQEFGKEVGVPIVATDDTFYLEKDEKPARTTLLSVQKAFGERVDDEGDFHLIQEKEALKLFKKYSDALSQNEKVVSKCNLDLPLGKWMFPVVDLPKGITPDEAFKEIVYEGFAKRGIEKNDKHVERVEYELQVIKQKGYAPYFLVVADLMRYAHEHGILSNIRGSVSGSLVTYLAGITNIDPIEYEIPFERFLNPDRPSAPDIDMDFADDRRDEMVEYAKQKYGEDKVAQIGTFGTMAARGSVRDVARALGYPVSVGDRIAKMIPMGSQGFPMTIEKALEENEELRAVYKKEADTKKIIDMAQKIEGGARHIGVHAAGVVISPVPLIDIVPLQYDPKGEGKIITQYDMYSIDEENAGLLKFDFLGLKNLSIIADTLKLAKKLKDKELHMDTIPIDDKKTFEMLSRGETADTFQLNGDGMTRFLIDLKPTSIHDINAMVALYRPGPIQFIPEYIARKHDPSRITYLDPALESILKKTYGILVYQDDLLIMAHDLAGYSWGEVDKFRKAVGKKIPKEMAEQKEKFIKGCIEHSKWSEKKAREIWGWIEPFAAYGFNKAHSVSYGRIAYITAYLKANFPGEYMSAVLTHESGDVEKVAESVAECKRMGIEVLPPDINQSFSGFTIVKSADEKEQIRFGLSSIKNFGEGIAATIIEERKARGKYLSLADFLERIQDRNLNKKSLESLIKSGSLDAFGERGELLGNIEELLEYNKETSRDVGKQSLFQDAGHTALTLKKFLPAKEADKLTWEKELLGLYISGHPLDKYRKKMEEKKVSIVSVKEFAREGQAQMIVGVVENVHEIRTKSGDLMAFVTLADFSGSMEAVFFPKIYKELKDLLQSDKVLAVEGTISKRNDETSIVANKVREL